MINIFFGGFEVLKNIFEIITAKRIIIKQLEVNGTNDSGRSIWLRAIIKLQPALSIIINIKRKNTILAKYSNIFFII